MNCYFQLFILYYLLYYYIPIFFYFTLSILDATKLGLKNSRFQIPDFFFSRISKSLKHPVTIILIYMTTILALSEAYCLIPCSLRLLKA